MVGEYCDTNSNINIATVQIYLLIGVKNYMTKFIYNGKEWESTGRQAIRSNKRDSSKDDILMEIRPIDSNDSDGFNVWVRQEDLYYITIED